MSKGRTFFRSYICLLWLICLPCSLPSPGYTQETRSIDWIDWRDFITYFDYDSDHVTDDSAEVCRAFADLAVKAQLKRIVITGHADTSGAASYNQDLSERRARAVAQQLVQHGVKLEIIEIDAKGESAPQVQSDDSVSEPLNRNVDITFLIPENEPALTAYVNSENWP